MIKSYNIKLHDIGFEIIIKQLRRKEFVSANKSTFKASVQLTPVFEIKVELML